MRIFKSKKTAKTKGFTLIELMVVISIIAFLSSVVLASINSAREKAQGAKIVGDMKSIQTALEFYRGKFGTYPNVVVGEGQNYSSFNDFVKTYLFDNKFISNIPKSKNYPNNCISNDPNCVYGNMFYYANGSNYLEQSPGGGYSFYWACGDKKITSSNYVLGYISNQKLNLPLFLAYDEYENQETPGGEPMIYAYTGMSGLYLEQFPSGDTSNGYGAYEYCLTF